MPFKYIQYVWIAHAQNGAQKHVLLNRSTSALNDKGVEVKVLIGS